MLIIVMGCSCYQALGYTFDTDFTQKRQSYTTTCSSISFKTLASRHLKGRSFKVCLAITHKVRNFKKFQGSEMILQAGFLKVVIIIAFCSLKRKKKTVKRRK